ncbi:MAG: hypothetical protein ABID45_01835 [Patescibacteria group bacterium]
MRIELKKFGTTLISRQGGAEAYRAFQPTLKKITKDENLEIDFSGVLTFSPSWGDEFLTPLLEKLGDHLILLPSDNMSMQATIKILQEINKRPFIVQK